MTEPQSPEPTPLKPGALLEIERVCDAFEAAWRAGQRPRIEDYVAPADASLRTQMLGDLVAIELEMRQKSGESVDLAEYRHRFPAETQHVDAVFRRVVGLRRMGDYEILEQLDQGGMGIVYRARQTFLNQIVALKLLPEHYLNHPQAMARFRREMQSLGRLAHPNIVRAYNAGESDGLQFLVMEYVDGVNLQRLMNDRLVRCDGGLSVGAACEVVRQAALGLQYAHEQKLVHRDVKPANLMLSRSGEIKLLDLGLAKFRDSVTLDDSGPGPLTEVGAAMGTVDYMAPEQWEHPSDVDIRADIYGLGCTLFFLLTGRPPYATPAFDTHRKRLMAHVVAPVPSLLPLCPDCPEDVDRILAHMLAKDPGDRFDTPVDVADAIGLFADPDQLLQLIEGAMPNRSSVESSSRGDTSSVRAGGSKKGLSSKKTPRAVAPGTGLSRWWPPRTRNVIVLGIAAVCLLALFVLWRWPMFATPPGTQRNVTADDRRAQQVQELLTLPGLNGGWWFSETPWLVPFARAAMAESMLHASPPDAPSPDSSAASNPALQSNAMAAQQWLLGMVRAQQERLSQPQQALINELIEISDLDLADEPWASRMASALEHYSQQLDATDSWTAPDWHTRAVLEHAIASATSDRSAFERAQSAYATALALYGEMGAPMGPLRALCQVDEGRLYAFVAKDYAQARKEFQEARMLAGAPPLFQAECLVDQAMASALANPDVANKYGVAGECLTQALQILEATPLGTAPLKHPFLAHIHERYAWILMDQWSVRQAEHEFEAARKIRYDNWWESKNELAQIFVFHNEHGQAMAERYFGDVRQSRGQYDVVISKVAKALADVEARRDGPVPQALRGSLRNRLVNSLERRADCDLYQGDRARGPADLRDAADLYARARDKSDSSGVRSAMALKHCLALAVAGDVDAARRDLATEALSTPPEIGVHGERLELLQRVLEATLALNGGQREAGRDQLRAFLRSFDLDPRYPDRHRRETQELQLLAAELLISSELADPAARDLAHQDAGYLQTLVRAFPYRAQMLPYLRRYYDLAIAAVGASDAEKVASLILASRDQSAGPTQTAVLFHFRRHDGCVVLRAPQGSAEYHALTFGRAELRSPQSQTAGKLRLPDALVARIQAERSQGHTVAMFWSDEPCWAQTEDALTDKDWPFAAQLDLKATAGTVTASR